MNRLPEPARGYLIVTPNTKGHLEAIVARLSETHVPSISGEGFKAWAPLPQLNMQYLKTVVYDGMAPPVVEVPVDPSLPMRSVLVATLEDDLGGWMRVMPKASTVFVLIQTSASVHLIDALGTIRQQMESDHVTIVAIEPAGGRFAIEYSKQVAHRRPSVVVGHRHPMAVAVADILYRHVFLGLSIEQSIQQPDTPARSVRDEIAASLRKYSKVNGSAFVHPSHFDQYIALANKHGQSLSVIWFQPVASVSPHLIASIGQPLMRTLRAFDVGFQFPTGDLCFVLATDSLEGLIGARAQRTNLRTEKLAGGSTEIFHIDTAMLSDAKQIQALRSRFMASVEVEMVHAAAE